MSGQTGETVLHPIVNPGAQTDTVATGMIGTETATTATHEPIAVQSLDTAPVVPAEPVVPASGIDASPAKASEQREGMLGYKAPGLISHLRYSKKYFWLGSEPIPHSNLKHIEGEKENVAWAGQTGKGLLLFASRVEDKAHPAGMINLSEITEVEKGPEKSDFSFNIGKRQHSFRAADKTDRDEWHSALEAAMFHAKSMKEDVRSSSGYKSAIGGSAATVGAAAGAGAVAHHEKSSHNKENTARSQSRKRMSGFFGGQSRKEKEVVPAEPAVVGEAVAADKTISPVDKGTTTTESAFSAPGQSSALGFSTVNPTPVSVPDAAPTTTHSDAPVIAESKEPEHAFAADPVAPAATSSEFMTPLTEPVVASTPAVATSTVPAIDGAVHDGPANIHAIVDALEGQEGNAVGDSAAIAPVTAAGTTAAQPTEKRRMSSFFGRGGKTSETTSPIAEPVGTETAVPVEEKKGSFIDRIVRRGSQMYKKSPSPNPATRTPAPVAATEPIADSKLDAPGVSNTATEATPNVPAENTTSTTTGQNTIGDVTADAVHTK